MSLSRPVHIREALCQPTIDMQMHYRVCAAHPPSPHLRLQLKLELQLLHRLHSRAAHQLLLLGQRSQCTGSNIPLCTHRRWP